MEIANRWADGEDSIRSDRDYPLDDEEPEPRYDASRRNGRNGDRRKRHKSHVYNGAEASEFIATQFPTGSEGSSRGAGA
jgi:hypothetical protein